MMQSLRIVAAIVVVAVSVGAFAAWLKSRSPQMPPGGGGGAGTAVAPRNDPASAQGELAQLQEKLAAAIRNQRGAGAVLPEARRIVERYPDHAPAHVTLAQVLSVTGAADEAYTHYVKALALNPRQPEVHDIAGTTALRLGRIEEAQKHYAEATGLEPRTAKYRLHLAVAQLRAGRHDDARATLLQAMKLDSSSHQAYGVLADLHAQQNKVDQGLDAINRALELVGDDPDYRDTYLRRKAMLLRRANRPDEAIVVMRQIPPKRWVEREILDEFAQTYMLLGQPEKAAEHYEAVLPLDPLADWAAEKAAQYRLKANQKDRARAALEALKRINPRAPGIPEIESALRE